MDIVELTQQLQTIHTLNNTLDTDALESKELFDLTIQIEEITATVHALVMPIQAAAKNRKAHKARHFRTAATGIASRTRLSAGTCGHHLSQAVLLVDRLSSVYAAYKAGVLNTSQINLICSYANKPKLLKPAKRDQKTFINWGHLPWTKFRDTMAAWAIYVDETDPSDQDEKDFQNRRLVTAQGLGRTILIEWNVPNEIWEEILGVVEPIYDMLFKEECGDARGADGEIVFTDLARNDRQRMCDAIVIATRLGGRVSNKLIAQKAAMKTTTREAGDSVDAGSTGTPADTNASPSGKGDGAPDETTDSADSNPEPVRLEDLDFSIDDLDSGIDPDVIIIADQRTLENEISRRNGDEPEPWSIDDVESFRCETLSGLPVSPATALTYLTIGAFRRMINEPDDLDFKMSRKARLFKGAKRLGLIVRSRHCRGAGCETKSHHCEADHRVEHGRGGLTEPENGDMWCRACHRHKTWLQAHGLWEEAMWLQQENAVTSNPLTG